MLEKYGIWGMSKFTSNASWNALLPYIKGYLYRLNWTDIQTGPSTYNWSYFDDQLQHAFDADLWIGFMITTGDSAPISGANDWLADFVPTFTNDRGTWPYYMDPDYSTYWYEFTDALVEHIRDTYTLAERQKILFMMSAEGSTGDEGPYKGTVPIAYEIDEDDGAEWDQFKRLYWTHLHDKLAIDLPLTHILINQGNGGDNYQWVVDNLPDAWVKAGNFTHNYSFAGEGPYADRLQVFRNSPLDENRVRGEFEGTDDQTFWQQSTKQNFMCILRSCIHAGIDVFSLSYTTHSTNGYGNPAYDFFNQYAGIRNVSESNRGFIAFRDEIDILDTVRFPTGTYGNLVTQNTTQFNNKYNQLIASECNPPNYDNCSSPEAIESNIVDLYLTDAQSGDVGDYHYLNPTRITNIRNAFPTAVYRQITSEQQLDSYNSPYSASSIPDNYSRFITQYSPNTTSTGGWNKGPVNNYYGRYTRAFNFNLSPESRKIYLQVDSGLDSGSDNSVTINLIYLDSGTGLFSIECATCKGKSEVSVIQKKNTNVFITKTVTVDKFLFGGNLDNSSDIIIKYLSGDNTDFDSLEIINNSI